MRSLSDSGSGGSTNGSPLEEKKNISINDQGTNTIYNLKVPSQRDKTVWILILIFIFILIIILKNQVF